MVDEFQFSMYFILICTFYDIFVKNYQTFYLKKKPSMFKVQHLSVAEENVERKYVIHVFEL